MSRRTLLMVSLLLNLLFIAGLARPRHQPAAVAPAEPAAPHAVTSVVGRVSAETPPSVVTTNRAVIPFHWRELESEDYRVYAAGLRAAGCPERTVRQILIADLEEHFRKLQHEEGRQPRPHWQTAAQRREWDRQRAARTEAREESHRALEVELFGREVPGRELYKWEVGNMTCALLGFLPDEKIETVVSEVTSRMEGSQRLRQKREQVLLPEDHAVLQKNYDAMQSQLAGLLTATEREELNLRLAIIEGVFGESHVKGVDLTGAEMRALARLRHETTDMLRDEMLGERTRRENGEKDREQLLHAGIRELLGEERYADYQRAQDGNFRGAFEFTQEAGLPKSIAIEIYDVRRAADKQADVLRKDKQLTADQRQRALTAIGTEIGRTLSVTLGNSYQKFREDYAGWLKNFQPPPPPKK